MDDGGEEDGCHGAREEVRPGPRRHGLAQVLARTHQSKRQTSNSYVSRACISGMGVCPSHPGSLLCSLASMYTGPSAEVNWLQGRCSVTPTTATRGSCAPARSQRATCATNNHRPPAFSFSHSRSAHSHSHPHVRSDSDMLSHRYALFVP
jgi:hypothetical protein